MGYWRLVLNFYATETYFTHFLEDARFSKFKFMYVYLFSKAPVLAGRKRKVLYAPQFFRQFWAQNRLDFQPNPSNGPRNVNAPHNNY